MYTILLTLALIGLRTMGGSAFVHIAPSLRIPASTAYCVPDAEALDIEPGDPVAGWSSPHERLVWHGHFAAPGRLDAAIEIALPSGEQVALRLRMAGQSRTANLQGAAGQQSASFGSLQIPAPGDYAIELAGVRRTGATYGAVDALVLSGPAAADAHFSMAKTRGAPSVHLGYPLPRGARVVAFFNEVTAKRDPLWTYYCACGFARGYFGMQVNSPTERRIIFSVWDAGNEAVDRSKVPDADRVALLDKGAGVVASSFGNEGTGGHSHLVYPWKTGGTYRFLVTARPQGDATVYNGYFYFPERHAWGLIASFRAPKDGGYLRGLYSFNEDFNGANGDRQRLALFGPQWVETVDGRWSELTQARFTHTSDGYSERLDRGAGVSGDRFYLTNGGFRTLDIRYGAMLSRRASGRQPLLGAAPGWSEPHG